MNAFNPLLDPAPVVPFDRIRAEHVVPAMHTLLDRARADVARIGQRADSAEALTWASTVGALETATEPLRRAWAVVGHLHSVAHTAELDAAHAAAQPAVTAFYAGLPLDPQLYATLRAYADTDEAQALSGPHRRYLDKLLAEFRRNGAELDPAGKARLEQIADALATLGREFATHVLEATAAWSLLVTDPEALAGLPDAALAMLAGDAAAHGQQGWRLSLAAPAQIAVLTHADDRALREHVWRASHARCGEGPYDNRDHIAQLIRLRAEQAELLGYAHFADYVTEDRMAGSGARADAFLADVEARCRPQWAEETDALRAHAASLGLSDLQPWDVAWVAERLRKAQYDFDEEALRPYLPFDRVLDGVFELSRRLYGVVVEPADLPVWHPSVRGWRLRDDDGRELGVFYTDFVPRASKRQGAWMNPLLVGSPDDDGQLTPHVGVICGNLTPPVGDAPALLSHREVETVFHEFGHLLHHLLTTVPIRDQAGTSVSWDFVELPSQVMENWTWEREGLDLIAAHHDTGAPVPPALFERMARARNFRAASHMMRQLGFGRTDLALHMRFDPARDGEPVAWGDAIMAAYATAPAPEGASVLPTFQHLFANPVGYAAGYYSYMWASVLDADVFTRFLEQGLFDRATGTAFRTLLLARGDSDDPGALFRAFMGRDPDPEAMLRRRGLAA